MTDQNRKTLRSFYCRDYLWEHFEQMAQELGCSMDYLINESMRLYARDRDGAPQPDAQQSMGGSGGRQPSGANRSPGPNARGPSQSQSQVAAPAGAQSGGDRSGRQGSTAGQGGDNHRTFQQVPSVGQNNRSEAPSQSGRGPVPPAQGGDNPGGPPPPPPRPGAGPSEPAPGKAPSNSGSGRNDQWQQNQSGPPQPPGGGYNRNAGVGAQTGGGAAPIYLSFNNNRYVIDQDKYVIGRGSNQTDLTIRDGNISRKHCAIIYRNGSHYIKDLDSTNGVEYRGNRIESKKIEEGDVFYLCDYELRFSFRG